MRKNVCRYELFALFWNAYDDDDVVRRSAERTQTGVDETIYGLNESKQMIVVFQISEGHFHPSNFSLKMSGIRRWLTGLNFWEYGLQSCLKIKWSEMIHSIGWLGSLTTCISRDNLKGLHRWVIIVEFGFNGRVKCNKFIQLLLHYVVPFGNILIAILFANLWMWATYRKIRFRNFAFWKAYNNNAIQMQH